MSNTKGKAVARQLSLWDSLMDARIQLQKAATSISEVAPSHLPIRSSDPSVTPSLSAMLSEAVRLSQDIFTLQEVLLHNEGTPSTHFSPRKRVKTSRDQEHDYVLELNSLCMDASSFEAAYHPHLIQTLAKWSTKVQAVAPSVLLPANRSSFKNTMADKTASEGVVQVITAVLQSDADKLLTRTRSGSNKRTADERESSVDAINVFDDTDFYQQLLRDVIDSRGTAAGVEEEWVRRQKAAKARRKKTVDTKASKGRKLRYQVHEKLQNFMVPIPSPAGTWHEEQADELFASLLGGQSS